MIDIVGKDAFEVVESRDYSGLSIVSRYLVHADSEKAFFNGTNLSDCVFDDVKFNNTEFTEGNIERSIFSGTDLSGSDLIDSHFEDCKFTRCIFEKGEWRNSSFVRCTFDQCLLTHTTVTLCTFANCSFDAGTQKTIEHRSAYFNVFADCVFERPFVDPGFSSRNFGIPTTVAGYTLVSAGSHTSIEHLCLLNNSGRLKSIDVVEVAEALCQSLVDGMQRLNSTLVFFSKIIRTLTEETRISATSLIYLEEVISGLAGSVDDQDLFSAAMLAIVEIRSALFSIMKEADLKEQSDENVREIRIVFSATYTRRQADALKSALEHTSALADGDLVIRDFRQGSTWIEITSAAVVSLGGLLVALNFVLRQAKIAVDRVAALKKSLAKAKGPATKEAKSSVARKPREKLPSILKAGPVAPELKPVREVVHRYGRILVEMDSKAEVRVLVEQSDGRR
jgi:hypothetical protein